jgi:DNA-binding PadR family transcriptional regulator
MPIQHAVLSLLSEGPSHGYELKSAFEQAVGPQWGPLNIGHLYQVLDRLSREGMVTSTRVAQEGRPERIVYEITDAGAGELAAWLAQPSPRASGFRDDYLLKLVAAARTRDPAVIEPVVARQRAFLLRELRDLHELRREHDGDLTVRLLLSAAARHVEADVAFLDEARELLVADAGEQPAVRADMSTVELAGGAAEEGGRPGPARRRRSA